MKRLLYAFSVLLFLSSCKAKSEETKKTEKQGKQSAPPPTIVDVIIAGSQNISNTLEANGSVVASEFLELRSEVSGRLTFLNVSEGSRVGRGTVVAKINDAELRAQRTRVLSQLGLAKTTVGRFKKLLDIQGINQADYDVAVNQVNTLNADLGVIDAQIAKTVVRAPFSGVVGLRQVSNGAYVTPADVIATLQKVDRVKIDFTVPENYAGVIKRGSSVVVEVPATLPIKTRATILAVEPQVSTTTRNVIVRAALDGGTNLNPGTFVKVYLETGSSAGIMVPANAIIPEARAKRVVIVKNGKAVFTDVQTGLRQAGSVQVVSGINAGDSIVVSGVLFAKPNAPLKVRSVKKLEEVAK
jgi:membrane fusion protein (multidrug efflux system)